MSIDEIFLETLQKSCHEARAASADLLLKSQMGFDFGSPSPNPHANHKAYQRTSASGAVSQIQQKGSPHQEMVKELHDAFERHDKKGRGGMGITHEHPDYSTPEKYAKTAKNILKFRGHERLGKKGAEEVEGMLKRHIGAIEGAGHEEAPSVGKLHSPGRYRVEVEASPNKGKDGVHTDNLSTHEDIREFVKKHGKDGSEVRIWDTTQPVKAGKPHKTLTVGKDDADE